MLTNFQSHEFTPFCWCHPRIEETEDGHAVFHHNRLLTVDYRPRARASLLEGVPA